MSALAGVEPLPAASGLLCPVDPDADEPADSYFIPRMSKIGKPFAAASAFVVTVIFFAA